MTNDRHAALLQVTPCLHVDRLGEALDWFTDVLGFRVAFEGGGYAYVERDAVVFRLFERSAPRAAAPEPLYAHYIDVEDLDALHAELAQKLADAGEAAPYGPTNQPWGMRELMLTAPDGSLIVFGQQLATGDDLSAGAGESS